MKKGGIYRRRNAGRNSAAFERGNGRHFEIFSLVEGGSGSAANYHVAGELRSNLDSLKLLAGFQRQRRRTGRRYLHDEIIERILEHEARSILATSPEAWERIIEGDEDEY